MTIIDRKQHKYCIPSSSPNVSDTESAVIVFSDSESIYSEASAASYSDNCVIKRHPSVVELHKKNSWGKRKLRRFQNLTVLQTLNEEDETYEQRAAFNVVDHQKTPFTRLLEDAGALSFWHEFIEKSEEEQASILERFSSVKQPTDINILKTATRPASKVLSRIKRALKIRKNVALSLVKNYEEEMLDFFTMSPNGVYICVPNNSFERLMVRAIAEYHKLHSFVMTEDVKRIVEIFNLLEEWTPAGHLLASYVEEFHL